MLVNHGRISLLIFVPLALVLTAAEIAVSACTGRFPSRSFSLRRLDLEPRPAGWRSSPPSCQQAGPQSAPGGCDRPATPGHPEADVARPSGGFGSYGMGESGGFLTSAGRSLLDSLGVGRVRIAWLAWAFVVAVVLFGSRVLHNRWRARGGGLPAVPVFRRRTVGLVVVWVERTRGLEPPLRSPEACCGSLFWASCPRRWAAAWTRCAPPGWWGPC